MAKQPEAKVSTAIMKAWRQMGLWCFKVHGSEYQPAGIPDICGVAKGISVWCETKMPGNKPSKIQKYRMNALLDAGAFVVVAYSVEDAVALIDHLDGADCEHKLNECPYRKKFDLELG